MHFSGLPMSFWTVMLRGWRLLFQYELTSDLSLLEQRRQAPPPTIAAQPGPTTRASMGGNASRYVVQPGQNGQHQHGVITHTAATTGGSSGTTTAVTVAPTEAVEPVAATAGLRGWQASWYTTHHHYIKPKLLTRMTIAFVIGQIGLWLVLSFTLGGDRNRCGFPETKAYSNVGTWLVFFHQ
jgi:hypothetical protein